MRLLLGWRPQQPFSDLALMIAIRNGKISFFRHLYRRHYAAVQAYASQCMPTPLQAQEAACRVFEQLLQQTVAGPLPGFRQPGGLRPHLLGNVRTVAITSWHRDRDTLSPDFQDWVAAGAQWPWGEDGQLAPAFEHLPDTSQCLLWHSMVEHDDPALTARITGLVPHEVPAACDEAKSALRQARADLYLERLERRQCREVIERLPLRPGTPPPEFADEHFRDCPACLSLYKDVTRLDDQLEVQLPVRVLGWWTGQQYLRAKAAISTPLVEPPFLRELLARARAYVSAERSRVLRTRGAATTRGFRQQTRAQSPLRLGRSRAAATLAGFLAVAGVSVLQPIAGLLAGVGVGVGVLALTARKQQGAPRALPPSRSGPRPALDDPPSRQQAPPALRAHLLIQADEYTSQQETSAGSGPGSRVLGRFSVLCYDRVDFSTERDTFAHARLAGPAGGGSWIELRLDSLTGPPLARITPKADGSVDDVSVPIAPVEGVHRVYVTAHCPRKTGRCVELHALGTATPRPSGSTN